jgi:CDP-diglyceride synthetase
MANKLLGRRIASFLILAGIVAFLCAKGTLYVGAGLAVALLMMLYEWYKLNSSKLSMMYILGNIYILIPTTCWLVCLFDINNFINKYMGFECMVILGIVSCSDTFAYIGGSILGGPKMAPKISPAKTWSGTLSGIVGPMIVAYALFGRHLDRTIITGLFAVCGVFGDLIESKAKRMLGVKDSGGFIPGHGGILDRLDSFLFASYAYFIFRFFFDFYYTADL